MQIDEDILIVGAGISGLTTSLGLYRYGLRSLVLESSDSLRTTGFALTLWTNAWRALDAVGVADHLRPHSLQLRGFQVASVDTGLPIGELTVDENKYGNYESRCIRRKELLETLEKELPQGTIRYSSKVVSIGKSGHLKLVHLADGCIIRAKAHVVQRPHEVHSDTNCIIRTKVLIGCDGVNSVVAKWLGLQKPISIGRSAIRGFAEYPAAHGFRPNFHAYFGGGVRFGFVPCDVKRIYWFFTFSPSTSTCYENMLESPINLKEFVLSKILNVPKEVLDIVERTDLKSISCAELKMRRPWDILRRDIAKSNICVAGDALHPMTPDIAQGGCSALEDSVILARCIGESFLKVQRRDIIDGKEDADREIVAISEGLENYAKKRRWRSFSLVATAYVVGYIQESTNKFIRFLREKFLSNYTIAIRVKMADYDCGKLER